MLIIGDYFQYLLEIGFLRPVRFPDFGFGAFISNIDNELSIPFEHMYMGWLMIIGINHKIKAALL